ncbi:MAG TPA: PspA/IM30 family protein [Myxococcota bacterium]|nr:PspA/IM30 family protein [Myxococcota bacterium]HKK93373.1 PspA/IM30 family protein [Longimicrobiales bacterium]
MGIFSKLSTLIKSNINDLINRAEDPEKMLNQIILDMRDQLAKAKREVAAAIADEHKLRGQLEDEFKQAKEWENRAMLAVKEGRDDLAKQALMRHQEHAGRAKQLDETWKAQSAETEKLRGSLRQLNEKIEEAKRKRNLLIAKQKRAQAQRKIHETMSGLSDTSAFEAFNRMADKIEESERKSIAAAAINEDLTGDSLEDEFKQLESGGAGGQVEGRLLELKRQMGLLSAPEEEEIRQLEAGDSDEGSDNVVEAEVEAVEEGDAEEDDGISEAELLEHFKSLEKNAEA